MPWECVHTPGGKPFATVTVWGKLREPDIKAIQTELRDLIRDYSSTGCLIDLSNCSSAPEPNRFILATATTPLPTTFRRAIIVPPTLDRQAEAWMTAAQNRNQDKLLFFHRDEAVEWLES